MQWILCFQTVSGGIKYYTADLDAPTYLPFAKFLEYITQYNIQNFRELQDTLDKYKTIFIDIDNGTWKVYNTETDTEAGFQELFKLNNKQKEKETDLLDKLKIPTYKQYLHNHSKIKSNIGMPREKDDNNRK